MYCYLLSGVGLIILKKYTYIHVLYLWTIRLLIVHLLSINWSFNVKLYFLLILVGWALSVSKEEIAQPQYASLKSLANVACLVLHWYEALAKHVTKTWREAHIIYFLQTLRKVRETFGHLMKDDIIVKSNQAVSAGHLNSY